MNGNEAQSRIKINKLLDEAGWRFFPDENGDANICLEQHVKITQTYLDELGNNFEKTKDGFTDYSLLGQNGNVIAVLEAKAAHLNPLVGKEQARAYAYRQKARFVILSNGSIHYLWDTWLGDPKVITRFPKLDEIEDFRDFEPAASNITSQIVAEDYIAVTQQPGYLNDPRWKDETHRSRFVEETKLKFLRPFQLKAIHRIQEEVAKGKDRFLFEMATGTGKTLTSAAVIKLFLRSGNVTRVLFLVDRLELEDQAWKNFVAYLKDDYTCKIYKENRDDWRNAEIVVSTVQSFLHNNKYRRIFKPNDFQLIISDEAHRSIGGNSRAVFEYFIGYKLGLTATPKNYLKKIDVASVNANDPRELERRLLLDTYTTFGCDSGEPTFSYSLTDGVKDGYLINPIVSDARTEITTQLLSDKGYSVIAAAATDQEEDKPDETPTAENTETFFIRNFEKKFFSENTNLAICKTFLDNALLDPITREIGKSIVFCVSQNHAAKIAQILNELASKMFPGKYQSDFAVQVTSQIAGAQQMTINFTNNNLNGKGNFDLLYQTSKTRVCVTVGMMTTGYDCPDILNVCLMRPIFSPTDFVQIKGRGTRKHNFTEDYRDKRRAEDIGRHDKVRFKLFDFFANCEYFEEDFDYDEVLKLPVEQSGKEREPTTGGEKETGEFESFNPDELKSIEEVAIGADGMKIDRRLFERFEDRLKSDTEVQRMVEQRDFQSIEDYIVGNLFDKPEDYYNLDKLRKTLKIDRRLVLREIVEKIFGFIPYFKTKEQLLEEEFDKFDSRYKPEETEFPAVKYFFKCYVTDSSFREILESKQFSRFHSHANGKIFFEIPVASRQQIVEYIKDNVPLNQFME